ncbi:hypothetical protein DV451_001815 [Geotrichum candidum]|uniref:Uncharacterized protein n=1 Tax=Geotrichum candidum TaxID=1173061 RepID=A0A9P5G6Z4_GEOCN|nr:hypothetical protein DV451_001815 [Geotrichum candidum]
MPALFSRGNNAVIINDSAGADFHITDHGSDWLWAAFSVFACCAIVSTILSYTKPRAERLFYNITSVSLLIMSVTYFTCASNLGWAPVQAEFDHVTVADQATDPGFRQVFYVRFIGWFLAFPLTLISYSTLFSLDWSNLYFTIATQWMTVLGLLIGSVVRSSYKWGYFTFACVGFILEAIQLLWFFRRSAIKSDFSKAGTTVTFLATLLLMLYPVAWALSYGGNVIQPDSEAVFFGVLDLSYFVILGAIFLYFTNGIDFSAHGIATLGAPVLHRSSYINPASVPASKEAVLERHSGETA